MPDFSAAYEDQQRVRRRGWILGAVLGILLTIALYFSIRLDPYGESLGAAPLLIWLSPLVVGGLLSAFPRTRSFGTGLAMGVAASWIVGVPACVTKTLSTVPVG